MKNTTNIVITLISAFFLVAGSCSKTPVSSDNSGNWIISADFGGAGRTKAASFVIDNIAYVGTGYNGLQQDSGASTRMRDFWKFSPAANNNSGAWTQIASLPEGANRSNAVGFTIGKKGYIATGSSDGTNVLSTAWSYDPETDRWTSIAPLPTSGTNTGARKDAVAFGIGGYGYVGTGWDGAATIYNNFYRYNPATDTWQPIISAGKKRYGAVAMVNENKAYIVTGIANGANVVDFWRFDPSVGDPTDVNSTAGFWVKLRDISNTNSAESYDDGYIDIARADAVAFTMPYNEHAATRGYITSGASGNAKTWEYDFLTDLWAPKATYERAIRSGAIGLSVGQRGFVTTGQGGGSAIYSDTDEFIPQNPKDAND